MLISLAYEKRLIFTKVRAKFDNSSALDLRSFIDFGTNKDFSPCDIIIPSCLDQTFAEVYDYYFVTLLNMGKSFILFCVASLSWIKFF